VERAVELWTDLRQFGKATKCAQTGGRSSALVDALRVQQAEWNEEVRDYKAAADMYLSSGQSERAVSLLARHSLDWSCLVSIMRKLDRYALTYFMLHIQIHTSMTAWAEMSAYYHECAGVYFLHRGRVHM
jgi:hypothetical protein